MDNDFDLAVYSLLKKIPEGRVTTYKEIGQFLGVKSYRQIGRVLSKNPHLSEVPCHRVVMSDGSIGGYVLGVDEKIRLLGSEGVKINNGKIVNFNQILYKFY